MPQWFVSLWNDLFGNPARTGEGLETTFSHTWPWPPWATVLLFWSPPPPMWWRSTCANRGRCDGARAWRSPRCASCSSAAGDDDVRLDARALSHGPARPRRGRGRFAQHECGRSLRRAASEQPSGAGNCRPCMLSAPAASTSSRAPAVDARRGWLSRLPETLQHQAVPARAPGADSKRPRGAAPRGVQCAARPWSRPAGWATACRTFSSRSAVGPRRRSCC